MLWKNIELKCKLTLMLLESLILHYIIPFRGVLIRSWCPSARSGMKKWACIFAALRYESWHWSQQPAANSTTIRNNARTSKIGRASSLWLGSQWPIWWASFVPFCHHNNYSRNWSGHIWPEHQRERPGSKHAGMVVDMLRNLSWHVNQKNHTFLDGHLLRSGTTEIDIH